MITLPSILDSIDHYDQYELCEWIDGEPFYISEEAQLHGLAKLIKEGKTEKI